MYRNEHTDRTVSPRKRDDTLPHGFQTVPVNWSIHDEHEHAFFQKLREITGGGA